MIEKNPKKYWEITSKELLLNYDGRETFLEGITLILKEKL
jgi:hypothetical protein